MKWKFKWPLVWRKTLEKAIAQEKENQSYQWKRHKEEIETLEEQVFQALGRLKVIALTKHLDDNKGRLRIVVEADPRLFRESFSWDVTQKHMAHWVAMQVEREFANVKVLNYRDEWEERKTTEEQLRKGLNRYYTPPFQPWSKEPPPLPGQTVPPKEEPKR